MARDWEHYLRPDHVLDLQDSTGIVQHADGAVPAWRTGYCTDDVARMVVVGCGLHRRSPTRDSRRMVLQGLAFLRAAAEDSDGRGLRNFMDFERRWLDDPHPGDHIGRAVWALGEVLAAFGDTPAMHTPARLQLQALLPLAAAGLSPHECAYWTLGLARALQGQELPEVRAALGRVLGRLDEHWAAHSREDWPWPLERLSYDNARFPQALLAAGRVLGREDLVERATVVLDWLQSHFWQDEQVQAVGNHWLFPGQDSSGFTGDEQPIDVAALCECLAEFVSDGQAGRAEAAVGAFDWFLGGNRLGLSLYDSVTAGCHDGLGVEVLNDNQGAESTLAFLQAAVALEKAGLTPPR